MLGCETWCRTIDQLRSRGREGRTGDCCVLLRPAGYSEEMNIVDVEVKPPTSTHTGFRDRTRAFSITSKAWCIVYLFAIVVWKATYRQDAGSRAEIVFRSSIVHVNLVYK